jgi:hypothetical protein
VKNDEGKGGWKYDISESQQSPIVCCSAQFPVVVHNSQFPFAMHSFQLHYIQGALFFVVSQKFFCGALSLGDLTHTRVKLSFVGFLHVNGDKTWIDFFLRKVVGFSPKVGFPKVNYCVYCAWLSLYDFIISTTVIFG